MGLYKGTHLTIKFEEENNRFVQTWYNSPNSIEIFKKEMLAYISFYEKFRPSQTLWLQQSFSLDLDYDTQLWIERHINKPGKRYGNKKIAIVAGEDVLSYSTVIGTFEETQSCLSPRHFATEEEARFWLDELSPTVYNDSKIKISFKGVDNKGSSIFKVECPSKNITDVIKSFKTLFEENEFIRSNMEKYSLLTKREKQILTLYAKGQKHQEIANSLYISLFTVRTHWKNVKRKLEIKSFSEVIKYFIAFNPR